ncbi:MAG: hypothetical protein ABIO81_10855 [Ginsengibacter sp.]
MMKNKILFLLIIFLFSFSTSKGQGQYNVGTSCVSTEPDSTVVSIALSGYGYPEEGRFSIEWILRGNAPENIVALTGLDGKFFAADSNHSLWTGTLSGENISWKKIGTADGVKALASMNGNLYALVENGEILERKATLQSAKWKRIARAANIKSLAALDGNLYASGDNELMKLNLSQHKKHWLNIGVADGVRSMTSYDKRLFVINTKDTLWQVQPYKDKSAWTEIGRYNGITFNIRIKQIAVLNNRLYALSEEGKLYVGSHSTDGNLSATAFAINDNNKTVVLVGVDLTGFDYSLTDDVKDIIHKERNIPKSALLINASHTHFCPSAQAYSAWADYLEHPDSIYLNNILKKAMVRAIEDALDNMSPADLYFGRGTTDIGMNRSSADPESPHDKTLDVLEARDTEGKIAGVLFLTGCHPVFDDENRQTYTISANFPGIARDIIRKKTGTDALFIQGCAGDINPKSIDHRETGRQLADDVFKIMNGELTKITGDISYSFDSVEIPMKPTVPVKLDKNDKPSDTINISSQAWSADFIKQLKTNNLQKTADIYERRNAKWADMMLMEFISETLPDKVPEYIQLINIGDWKFVGLSREVVTEYAPAIRNIWPGKIVSVAGYCNDVASYLPNKWHVVNHHYEGYDSFFWYGQPGVPRENVFDVIIKGIEFLKR